MVCPNKNTPEWKELVNRIGEENAMVAFVKSGNQIPDPFNFPKSKDATFSPLEESPLARNILLNLGESFKKKLNVNFKTVDSDMAAKIYGKESFNDSIKSFWDASSNTVYLIKGRAGFMTALHEFTHPFTRYIRTTNDSLFKGLKTQSKNYLKDSFNITPEQWLIDNGYSKRIVNGVITEEGWEEIITSVIEEISKNIIKKDDKLSNAVSKSLINYVDKFWKYIGNMLKSIFPKSNITASGISTISNLSLEDLAVFMLDEQSQIDLSSLISIQNDFFEKIETPTSSAYSAQIDSFKERTGKEPTIKQLQVIGNIISNQNLKLTDDSNYYTDGVKKYQRTTDYLKSLEGPNEEKEYYVYHGNESDSSVNREWGSQIDDLVQGILEDLNFEDSLNLVNSNSQERKLKNPEIKNVSIEQKELEKIYNSIKNTLKNEYPNSIILPQILFYDKDKLIAGTADLVLIDGNGFVKILDVKSSIKSTLGDNYKKKYFYQGNPSASTFERYTAQLSIYKALAKNMGFKFDESSIDLGLIPTFIRNNEDNTVTNLVPEPIVNISAYEYILNKFNSKEGLNVSNLDSLSKEGELISKIKIILTKRIKEIEKVSNKKHEIKELQNLVDLLNQTEKLKALNLFVDQVYNTLISKELSNGKIKPGLTYEIKKLNRELENSNSLSNNEALDKYLFIKNSAEMFEPILDSLNAFKRESGYNPNSDNETLSKINECISAISYIKQTYKNEVPYHLTEILYKNVSQSANSQIEKEIKFKKDRIKEVSKTNSKKAEVLQKELDKEIVRLKSEKGVTKNVIFKSLTEGSSEDINSLDLWLTPLVSSSNELLSTFGLNLKKDLENARQNLLDFENIAAKAFEEYKNSNKHLNSNNPSEFNSKFYEEVSVFTGLDEEGNPTYKKELQFINSYDVNAFEKAKAELSKKLKESTDYAYKKLLIKNFRKDYFKKLPKEDITITNPYTNEKVVIQKGIDSLIKDKTELYEKGLIPKYELDNYIKSSQGKIEGDEINFNKEFLTIDDSKIPNLKYKNLNSSESKYYDFLISSYLNSQKNLPNKLGYKLPSIRKTSFDQVNENGLIDYVKYKYDSMTKKLPEDIDKYGEENKSIPMIYNYELSPSETSLDLISSVILYKGFTLDYSAKEKNIALGETLLDIIKNNPPTDTDSLGNKYLDNVAEKLNIKDELLIYKKKNNNNNLATLLAIFIDTQIYGKHQIEQKFTLFGKTLDLNKLTGSLMNFASTTQVGGNPIGSLVNYLQGTIQVNIEAAGKQFFSDKEWLESRLEYDKYIGDYLRDFTEPVNKSFIGQLIDTIDPMQGEFKDAAGRKISQNMFKKLWSKDTWFFLQHQGEHSIQVRTMLAMLMKTKVKDDKGNLISMLDAYKQNFEKNKSISLKGYSVEGNLTDNGKISLDLQNKLHAINKRMHGIYNSFDKPAIERYALGRLLTMYKKFLVPGFKRRYKDLSIDQEAGVITEGYLKTFFKKAHKDYNQLIKFYLGIDKNYFSEFEKENLRKAGREMLIVMSTGLIVTLIAGLMESADDDEKLWYRRVLFPALKLNKELGAFGTFGDPQSNFVPNFNELYYNFKSPSAIIGTGDRFFKLVNQGFHPTETYQRDTGIFNKGDSKLLASFMKFWGITGVNYDPEESIKWMKMSTK